MKKAIITGSSGFIGRVLQLKLREAGYYVIGIDSNRNKVYSENCDEFYNISYANIGSSISETLLGATAIFHLGANSLLGPSVNDPLKYYQNNVSEMAKMLKNLVSEWWGGAFIFASSAATYGDVGINWPLDEKMMDGHTINPYGSTKLVGEMMLRESCAAYGLKAYSMRFFNVAGAYKGVGQAVDQPHILTRMSMGLEKEETFFINGDNYETSDGTCVRDYIHVSDVCDALIAAAEKLNNEPSGTYDDFNVCSGKGVSNKELAEQFSEIYPFNYSYKPSRPGDPAHLVGDPGKMNRELGVFANKSLKEIILSHHGYIQMQNRTQPVDQPWNDFFDEDLDE